MIKIAVVGGGWRAEFYLRLANSMPDRFQLVGIVVRNSETAAKLSAKYQTKSYASVQDLLRHEKPDYVVSSVSWISNPGILEELVAAKIHVLSETPPAPDTDALRKLWANVGPSNLVQVAEQYLLLPGHASRMHVVKSGAIGTATSVEVSSTHGYHAISMMRGFLASGYGRAKVSAQQFEAPLVNPLLRDSWNHDLSEKNANTTIAMIDFGDHGSGIYNFVDNQWHNQLRHRRIVIRGSKGEIVDDTVIRLVDSPTIVTSHLERYQLGYDLNLDGYDTEHISFDGNVIYKNPFIGHRFMDEEIAIATMMVRMGDWSTGSADSPYPLREACQDHLISLAMDQSIATGESVCTAVEAWSDTL